MYLIVEILSIKDTEIGCCPYPNLLSSSLEVAVTADKVAAGLLFQTHDHSPVLPNFIPNPCKVRLHPKTNKIFALICLICMINCV